MEFEYVDVTKDKAGLERMLRFTKGEREVPVIVDGDHVTIGFGGS